MSTLQTFKRAGATVVDRFPTRLRHRVRSLALPRDQRGMVLPTGTSPTDNVAYNEELWDWYAERWQDPAFRAEQLVHEGRSADEAGGVARLGEEWGRLDDAVAVIDAWILPHVHDQSVVGEIGTGGGRVASRVAPSARAFHAFDVSSKMLELVGRELSGSGTEVHLHHLPEPVLPASLDDTFDFFYSFDVFVHIDLHTQWRYVQEIARVLKPGAQGFLHTANLTTDAGWDRFAIQGGYRVEGFYFMTPQAVRTLIERAGLEVVAEHQPEPGNFYLERDHLVRFRKPT